MWQNGSISLHSTLIVPNLFAKSSVTVHAKLGQGQLLQLLIPLSMSRVGAAQTFKGMQASKHRDRLCDSIPDGDMLWANPQEPSPRWAGEEVT